MSARNNGGPAFPVIDCSVNSGTGEMTQYQGDFGVSILDYFAAKAMQALLTRHGGYEDDMTSPRAVRSFSESAPNVDQVAEYAYAQAVAMLLERAK